MFLMTHLALDASTVTQEPRLVHNIQPFFSVKVLQNAGIISQNQPLSYKAAHDLKSDFLLF